MPILYGGFTQLDKAVIEVLNLWATLLYEPLLEDKVRPIQAGLSGTQGRLVAEKVHSELARLGTIKPPRAFVFLDRAAVGIGSAFIHLRAELNWFTLFHQLIDDLTLAKLTENQHHLLQKHHIDRAIL